MVNIQLCLRAAGAFASVVAGCLAIGFGGGSAQAAPPAMGGIITAVNANGDGTASVVGWVCQVGSVPFQVQVYADEAFPQGQFVEAGLANRPIVATGTSKNLLCGSWSAPAGFSVTIAQADLFRMGGLPVLAYAVSPSGPVALLQNSGQFTLPEFPATPAWTTTHCLAGNLSALRNCAAKARSYGTIALTADIACGTASACCPTNSGATVLLTAAANLTVEGNGHTLARHAAQTVCPALLVNAGSNVLVHALNVDEDGTAPPCELATNPCANTVSVQQSKNVRLSGTNVYFGKGYVVDVWGTDGFAMAFSTVSEAGMIGLYVGHWKYAPSKNVAITRSQFVRARTNGVAIQGASAGTTPNLVMDNLFLKNHWHGLWPVAGIANGITSGGELLIDDAASIRVAGNAVGDGRCENCNPTGQPVPALELGEPSAAAPGGVSGLEITGNYFFNGAGEAVYQNPGSTVGVASISGNIAVGYAPLAASQFAAAHNQVIATTPSLAQGGWSSYQVLRIYQDGLHHEAKLISEYPGGSLQGIFGYSPSPRPGADPRPLVRCFYATAPVTDFVSRDRSCGGQGTMFSVLGFAYEAGHPGVAPTFWCAHRGVAHDGFVSWSPTCEGQTVVAPLGFAIPFSTPTPMLPPGA